MDYIYLYGMVMSSDSIRLKWDYPVADGYCEIDQRYYGLGGETGTSGAILSSLGCNIKFGGSHLGFKNNDIIREYFNGTNADLSELVYDKDFKGVEDIVLIDKKTRTCFGEFATLFTGDKGWIERPSDESVKNSKVVGCDPFFGEEIAELCIKHNKKYAVIDCKHDSLLNKNCSVNAISHHFIKENYPDMKFSDVMKLYTENTEGLVIFTQGEDEVIYSRKGGEIKYFKAYDIDVKSTLGAGDSFKAGTIYGLYMDFDDDKLVEFATATAAHSCLYYPIPEYPATLEGVAKIINSR